jgi:hypothetical protein
MADQKIQISPAVGLKYMINIKLDIASGGDRRGGFPGGPPLGEFCFTDIEVQTAPGDIKFDHVAIANQCEWATSR